MSENVYYLQFGKKTDIKTDFEDFPNVNFEESTSKVSMLEMSTMMEAYI